MPPARLTAKPAPARVEKPRAAVPPAAEPPPGRPPRARLALPAVALIRQGALAAVTARGGVRGMLAPCGWIARVIRAGIPVVAVARHATGRWDGRRGGYTDSIDRGERIESTEPWRRHRTLRGRYRPPLRL